MHRELHRLRAAAAGVETDLARTLGSEWTCLVDDDYILTVSSGTETEVALLHSEIEDENWYVPGNLSPAAQDDAFDSDAFEAVATETSEVLRVLGRIWPWCNEHGKPIEACSGIWYCEGPAHHDLAPVGSLGQ